MRCVRATCATIVCVVCRVIIIHQLVAVVYDHDQLSSNDLLGEVQLDLSRIFSDEGGETIPDRWNPLTAVAVFDLGLCDDVVVPAGIGCHSVEGDYLLGSLSGDELVGSQRSNSRLRSQRSDDSGICGKLHLSCRFQCRRQTTALPPPLVQFCV